ncbi:MAG: PAS domain S-box protein [Rhodospirillales bacterium]|nr:PAS domain S-box protein [Rhodospirillales bacterium]
MDNKHSISLLNGTFKEKALEQKYRSENWDRWAAEIKGPVVVAVFLYLTSLFVDYIRFGDGSSFATALFVKLTSFGLVCIAAYLTKRPSNQTVIEFTLFLAALFVSGGLMVSAILSQENLASHTIAGLLGILAYYLFVPNRLLWTVIASVSTSIAYPYVAAHYYNSQISELVSLVLIYTAANVLGYITVVRIRTLHRKEYVVRSSLKQKIKELHETNENLRQSQDNVEHLFDSAPLPLVLVSTDNPQIIKANDAARRFFLITDKTSGVYKTTDFLPLPENRADLRQALATKGEVRNVMIQSKKADGTKVWGLVSALPVTFGGEKARMIAYADITERRRVEERLRNSEEELQTIIHNMPDVFYRTDAEGYITIISPATTAIIGYTPEELLGKKMSDLYVDPDDRVRVIQELVAAKGKAIQVEAFMTRKDKKIIWVSTRAFLRLDEDGNILGVEGIARDLTDKKQLEDRLRNALTKASDANKAKSKFLAAASHDLRQPLQALMLYAGVLSSKAKTDEEAKVVHELENGLSTMSELLDVLLDISKLEAGAVIPQLKSFSLNNLCDRLSARFIPVANEKGINLKLVTSSLTTHSDPVLLESILSNLITNAIRYTETGKILVGFRRRGENIQIGVWDTGIGISQEDRGKIFDDFYQINNEARDRRQGLGLGLSIVDRTIKLLNHSLAWTSEEGKGSCFIVTVPLADTLLTQESDTAISLPDNFDGVILLIDDDESVLFALSSFLTETGFTTIEATSQEEALSKLTEEPALIMADYRLSQGNIGTDAIEAVQKHFNKKIPAIIITGDTEPDRLSIIQSSNFKLLHKPIDHRKMLEAIKEEMQTKKEPPTA